MCDDCTLIDLPYQQTSALFAYLALKPNHSHPREELIAALWPDDDPDSSRQKLRQNLYSLRELLQARTGMPDDAIIATRTTVRLDFDPLRIDIIAFDEWVSAASKTRDLEERIRLLTQALTLYRAELLPGYYLEVFLAERKRLADIRLRALHLLTLALEQAGEIERAMETARQAVAIDPLIEEAHCDLMRLYAASGQPSAVLRQYQELERTLESELGERPSDTTRNLMESLRLSGLDQVAAISRTGRPQELLSLQSVASTDGRFTSRRQVPTALLIVTVTLLAGIVGLHFWNRSHTPRGATVVAPTLLWEQRVPLEPGDGDSEPTAIAFDPSSEGACITGFVQTAKRDVDFLTVKYDKNGTLLWESRYNGPGNDVDWARSISLGDQDDVFVTGESDNGRGNGIGRHSGLDLATIRYDASGKQLWVARYNGPGNGEERASRVVSLGDGNCCVAGWSWDGTNADGSPKCAALLIRYDAHGKEVWKQRTRDPDSLDCRYCDLQRRSGGVIAVGRAVRKVADGFETECFLASYDVSGRLKWRRPFASGMSRDDSPLRLTVDSVGNSYVAGYSHNFQQSDNGAGSDYLLARYDPDGNVKWSRSYDGPAHREDRVRCVTVGQTGNVTVTGESTAAPNVLEIATVQYDAQGQERWAARSAGTGHFVDSPEAMTAFGDQIYVTGKTSRGLGDETVFDYVTLKYDSNGRLVWRATYDGSDRSVDRGVGIMTDSVGNVFVTGQSSAAGRRTILTLKYAP